MGFDPGWPADWQQARLKDLTASGSITYGVVQPGLIVKHGVPMLRVNNFRGFGLDTSDVLQISPEIELKHNRTRLQAFDVLITVVGSVGQVAIVPPELTGWNIARAVALIRPKTTELAQWIALCLRDPGRQHSLGTTANTTVQTTINLKDLGLLSIPVPPSTEQSRICALMSALDDRIDLLRQTNTTLESIAQALFKSWFIDFDPVRAKQEGREPEGMDVDATARWPDRFVESAVGAIPEGWHVAKLDEVLTQAGGFVQTGPFGSQLHASDYLKEGVPVVMPQDMEDRRVSTQRIARVSEQDAQRLARHRMIVGDIVFSRRGDVGRHAIITPLEAGWLCGTGCLLVRPGPSWLSPAYLSQVLAHPETTDWLKQHAVGATMPNLNTGILSDVPILVPDKEALQAFEAVAGALDAKLNSNLAQISTLTELRDTLLPRLISGKLRLPEARSTIEDATA